MSNAVEQSRAEPLSAQDIFQMRMEAQCHQIREYRQALLREGDCLLSLDEAALEWIERFADSFDCGCPG